MPSYTQNCAEFCMPESVTAITKGCAFNTIGRPEASNMSVGFALSFDREWMVANPEVDICPRRITPQAAVRKRGYWLTVPFRSGSGYYT